MIGRSCKVHLPGIQVKDWLREVAKWEEDFLSVQSTMTTANGNTSAGSCCFCSFNFKLNSKIAKGLVEVKELIEKGNEYDNRLVGVDRTKSAVHIPAISLDGQPTAMKNLGKLMDLLNDENAKRIGVWGMGGVGKTTLINTYQHCDMGCSVPAEKREHGIASRLYNMLVKQRNFLLILDDVWNEIDLDQVGLPPPENRTGSKVMLTSRSLHICGQMATDINFELHHLCPEEAWNLFSQYAGDEVIEDDQIKECAKAVVKECDGLPLAIVVVRA